jgi:hypothetical protein
MAARSNACSEITRFWLEARHGLLVTESVPVPVKNGQSDLDLVGIHPKMKPITLPNGQPVRPRLIIETKDEHDYDPKGREFGKLLRRDVSMFGQENFVPSGSSGEVKFSMLRQAHYDVAARLFGSEEFDRLFVVHAIEQSLLEELQPFLSERGIYWLTIREVIRDLRDWYRTHPRPSGLRHSLVGDIWHLLFGYCGVDLQNPGSHES